MNTDAHSTITKEISCRITRTLLLYVRGKNRGTLGNLLDGLPLDEDYLSDTNNWVAHEFLQTLYARMIEMLGDQNAVYHMTLASGRLQSLGFLDRIVRLLGSPKLIYSQAPKYNKFLKLNGSVFIHDIGDSWVVLEDRYHDSAQKTRFDCDYTRGILEGIPTMFGLPPATEEELLQMDPLALFSEPSREKALKRIEEVFSPLQDPAPTDYVVQGKDGRQLHVVMTSKFFFENGVPKRLMTVVHDLSEVRKAEEEKRSLEKKLQNARKLESLGTLAGGVAHDLNNILSGVISYPELLLFDIEDDSPLRKPLLAIKKSGERAAEIVQDLLTLARRSVAAKKVISLNHIVSDFIASPEYRKIIGDGNDLAGRMMQRLGYEVHTTDSGEAAVALIKKETYDLLILDMIMPPGMNGLETYRQVLTIVPDQKAVIASGYAETENVREAQRMGAGSYIRKPYTLEKIGLAVRSELDRKPPKQMNTSRN